MITAVLANPDTASLASSRPGIATASTSPTPHTLRWTFSMARATTVATARSST